MNELQKKIAGFVDRKVFSKTVAGEELLEVEMPDIPKGYMLLYQVVAMPSFIGYVYKDGLFHNGNVAICPRFYNNDKGVAYTPIAVRFKK